MHEPKGDGVARGLAGAPMLLPLTQSLYVEGELADAENVLIDIGTGYFLEVPVSSFPLPIPRSQMGLMHMHQCWPPSKTTGANAWRAGRFCRLILRFGLRHVCSALFA